MFNIEKFNKLDLSNEEEITIMKLLFDRQEQRVERKAKALSDNEFVSSYLVRPYVEEEREVTHGEQPTSTKKYDEDELRWHRGDVSAATMVMTDMCDTTETIVMLQGLIRHVSDMQFNGYSMKDDFVYWSDFAEEILSC